LPVEATPLAEDAGKLANGQSGRTTSPAARALYRSSQVWHALRPRIDAADYALVCQTLGEDLARLFFAMERRDQRHAVAVAGRLLATGETDADLLAAGLLHDCGKGGVPVWLRVVNVLSPKLLRRLAKEDGIASQRAAFRLLHHEKIGVEKAREAGASEATLRFILGRPHAGEEDMLAALHAADDAS